MVEKGVDCLLETYFLVDNQLPGGSMSATSPAIRRHLSFIWASIAMLRYCEGSYSPLVHSCCFELISIWRTKPGKQPVIQGDENDFLDFLTLVFNDVNTRAYERAEISEIIGIGITRFRLYLSA